MQRMPSSLRSKIHSGSLKRSWVSTAFIAEAVVGAARASCPSRLRGADRPSAAAAACGSGPRRRSTRPSPSLARRRRRSRRSAACPPRRPRRAARRSRRRSGARVSPQRSEPAGDRLQRALHALLGRRVRDEAVHPLGQGDVRRVRGQQRRPRPRRGASPRRGRRPRPARRGSGSGGRASRSRRPRRLATASRDTSVPTVANSSPAATSSFSRLRRASARLWFQVGSSKCKRRVPPVGATLSEPE